ncbi:MAG: putative membrane protein YfcA [Pseudoalteromonas tetraodonis]|jgi:uncharacterized membrane protein YfcA
MIALVVAGFIVGIAVGATGVGGGALMTPILIIVFGISPSVAVGTDLLFATGTKGFGVFLHRKVGSVRWPIVARLASGSIPASLATIYWLDSVGMTPEIESLIKTSLGVAVAATALGVLLKAGLSKVALGGDLSALRAIHEKFRTPATVLGGLALGVLVTLSSVGAGVIGATLLLILYPRLRAMEVVGTDLAHAVPLTLIAGLGHMHLGTTDYSMLGFLLIGSLPGIYLGTRLGIKLPDKVVKNGIAVMLLIIGISMFFT